MKLHSLKPHEFNEQIQTQTCLVIDVRQPEEWALQHIAQAKLIPLANLTLEINKHHTNPQQPVYVYCQHGVRSYQAGLLLLSLGYEQVFQLEGGLAQWISSGFPCQSSTSEL
jgi:rhodanese-related sulfurtransferase